MGIDHLGSTTGEEKRFTDMYTLDDEGGHEFGSSEGDQGRR